MRMDGIVLASNESVRTDSACLGAAPETPLRKDDDFEKKKL